MGNYMTTMAVAEQAEDINLALIEASSEGNTGQVKMLLENGAEINKPSNNGNTALHLAGGRGHTETVVLLLKKGADINLPSKKGETTLHLASEFGHKETVELLLKKGANLSSLPEDKQTDELKALSNKYQEDSKLCASKRRLGVAKDSHERLGKGLFDVLGEDVLNKIIKNVDKIGTPLAVITRTFKEQRSITSNPRSTRRKGLFSCCSKPQTRHADKVLARKAEPEPESLLR